MSQDHQAELDKGTAMSVTTLGEVARKADTAALITNGTDSFPEDHFNGAYWTGGQIGSNQVAILKPIYAPGTLKALTVQNNILSQCVEAMEVNIDGTGHSVDLRHEEDRESGFEDAAEKGMLQDFFDEPYPGKSMIEIRRAIRQDREATGNGYMEVIRNAKDEVMMLNHLDADTTRLVAYDEPVVVQRTLVRGGGEVQVQVRARERRFVQDINGKKVFFKEFGASRDLDRKTGQWSKKGARLPIQSRASEVLHFSGKREPKTSYGSPRWINQLPSALGSRKAEEFNLEYFDGGGIPPLLMMVMGGYLAEKTKQELTAHFSAKGNKHRAAIVEAVSSSGSLDSSGSVQIRVERFGSERQSDAMFMNYDKACEEHLRVSFRLPPLFLGKAQDYNFATAYTAYMVAEAQVFYPERDEFDAKINNTVVKALGATKYVFRSLPLTLTDVGNQLKALGMVSEKYVSGEEVVSKLNEITGLAMKFDKQAVASPLPEAPVKEQPAQPKPEGRVSGRSGDDTTSVPESANPGGMKATKADGTLDSEMIKLAADWINLLGLDGTEPYLSDEEITNVRKSVESLQPVDSRVFNELVATSTLTLTGLDTKGLGELCGCATELAGHAHDH